MEDNTEGGRPEYAEEKWPAVLSVWTEKRKPGEFVGTGGGLDVIEPVAGTGDRRDASGPSASGPMEKEWTEPSSCGIVGGKTRRSERGLEHV